ncbi:MAG: hypothetical protein ACFFG0_31575 [Candidatus Thorarchaeota archaeon]
MVESVLTKVEHEELIAIPEIDVEGKENIGQYFNLMLAGTPRLNFSITDNKGKELVRKIINVELG